MYIPKLSRSIFFTVTVVAPHNLVVVTAYASELSELVGFSAMLEPKIMLTIKYFTGINMR